MCQILFLTVFVGTHIDDVIVVNHNFEVWFWYLRTAHFNIEIKSLSDILILWPKIKFQKNVDFSMKFPYGLCILKREISSVLTLKAFKRIADTMEQSTLISSGVERTKESFRLADWPMDQATKECFENIEKNSLRILPVIVIGRLVISKTSLIVVQMN